MLELKTCQLARGGRVLIDEASFALHKGQRMALTGINGSGKSSLFSAILGDLAIDAGDIILQPRLQISHMAQEIKDIDHSARDYVLDGFEQFRTLQKQEQKAIAAGDDKLLSEALGELDSIQSYRLPNMAETILLGLGFKPSDYDKKVADFSGGWRIRLNLARTLFSPADLLLLDEPTNHLDIEAIQFLENWLNSFDGAVILISHDRDFIDSCCNKVAHLEHQALTIYSGNYSDFERQRAERLAQQQSVFEKQEARKKELQSFIDRFKAKATKAKQAQSRIKALEKMTATAAVREVSPYQLYLPCSDKVSSPLINAHKINAGYQASPEDITILREVNFSILPGQRIGLLGVNGAGKSSLIKTIARENPPLTGEIVEGEHLRIGYFAQHQLEALDHEADAMTHIQRISPEAREQEIRDFLGRFNIAGDQATTKIAPFSGGEKARLALALIAWQKPNLLLLDEPTNHLDIAMREALAEALQAYEGAVLLVSHDRYLLRHCVDEFWLVKDGGVDAFNGSLDDYYALEKLVDKAQKSQEANEQGMEAGEAGNDALNKKQARIDAANKRKQLAPLSKKVQQLEKRLEKNTETLEALQEQLADSAIYAEENKAALQQVMQEEKEAKQAQQDIEEAWEEAMLALEDLESSLD